MEEQYEKKSEEIFKNMLRITVNILIWSVRADADSTVGQNIQQQKNL